MKRYNVQVPVKRMEEGGWIIDPEHINDLFMAEVEDGKWVKGEDADEEIKRIQADMIDKMNELRILLVKKMGV